MITQRGIVHITMDNGDTYQYQGIISVRDLQTSAQVEYADHSRKSFPVHTVEVRCVLKDESYRALHGGG